MRARWSKWSEAHIADDVAWHEVEEALMPPIVTQRVKAGALEVLGQTFDGRYLALYVAPDEDQDTVFVITARTMTDSERRRYRNRKRKG